MTMMMMMININNRLGPIQRLRVCSKLLVSLLSRLLTISKLDFAVVVVVVLVEIKCCQIV